MPTKGDRRTNDRGLREEWTGKQWEDKFVVGARRDRRAAVLEVSGSILVVGVAGTMIVSTVHDVLHDPSRPDHQLTTSAELNNAGAIEAMTQNLGVLVCSGNENGGVGLQRTANGVVAVAYAPKDASVTSVSVTNLGVRGGTSLAAGADGLTPIEGGSAARYDVYVTRDAVALSVPSDGTERRNVIRVEAKIDGTEYQGDCAVVVKSAEKTLPTPAAEMTVEL